jgi:predicted glycosyltransferase
LEHYHYALSKYICHALLQRIAKTPSVLCVLLRRANDDTFDDHLANQNIVIFPHPVEGLNLIAGSDLVFCGGGTMAREAAAMGVPSFSFFTGRLGAVDDLLIRTGRLRLIRSVDEIMSVRFEKRTPERTFEGSRSTLNFFIQHLYHLATKSQETTHRRSG